MTRGSVRLRLTLLFTALFLASGAALLGITYGLVSNATNGIIVARISSAAPAGDTGGGEVLTGPAAGTAGLPLLPVAQQVQAGATRYAADTRAREDDALLLYFAVALAIMAVVATALGWFAAGRALRPLRRITESARRISATNLHERLALAGPDDDLRELADMIDGLFARLDAALQAQRQFAANASHELRTPLARARTLLEVALRDPAASAASLRTACERAIVAGAEQERLIEALLVLARGQRGLGRREPLDLGVVTRDVLSVRGTQVTASGLTVEVSLAPALLAGDAALAERAVANLTDNALRHNRPGGAVWISVASDAGRAVLTVANTGPEIAPDAVDRLLLPFHRGGAVSQARRARTRSGPDDGLGLGLSIVAAVAAAHGADLTVTPRLNGGGLSVRLAFPPVPPALRPAADLQLAGAAGRRPG
jgi:signal transduction histidine kinase